MKRSRSSDLLVPLSLLQQKGNVRRRVKQFLVRKQGEIYTIGSLQSGHKYRLKSEATQKELASLYTAKMAIMKGKKVNFPKEFYVSPPDYGFSVHMAMFQIYSFRKEDPETRKRCLWGVINIGTWKQRMGKKARKTDARIRDNYFYEFEVLRQAGVLQYENRVSDIWFQLADDFKQKWLELCNFSQENTPDATLRRTSRHSKNTPDATLKTPDATIRSFRLLDVPQEGTPPERSTMRNIVEQEKILSLRDRTVPGCGAPYNTVQEGLKSGILRPIPIPKNAERRTAQHREQVRGQDASQE